MEKNFPVDCAFKHTDIMGVIFEFLTLYENIIVLQHLNKRIYYLKMPTFVKKVYFFPQFELPIN